MNMNQIKETNEAYESVLTALTFAAAGFSDYHKDATEQDTADALCSLAGLYEEKSLPRFGALANNTRGGLFEAYARIFHENADFEGFRTGFDSEWPISVVDGVISIDEFDNLSQCSSLYENLDFARNNMIALAAQAINLYNVSGHKDVDTYNGASNFEAIEAQYEVIDLLERASAAVDHGNCYTS